MTLVMVLMIGSSRGLTMSLSGPPREYQDLNAETFLDLIQSNSTSTFCQIGCLLKALGLATPRPHPAAASAATRIRADGSAVDPRGLGVAVLADIHLRE